MASQKIVGVFPIEDPTEKLMYFLLRHGLAIASSCDGEGVCRKCVVNENLLSCQISVGEWQKRYPELAVEISYL